MQIKLQHRLGKKNLLLLFFPFLLAVTPAVCPGQSVLKPGDLVVVSISSGSSLHFEFVPLVNLEKGTVIHFADYAYLSEAESPAQAGSALTYTASGAITAGTIISYTGSEPDFNGGEPGTGSLGTGNNLLVYQVSDAGISFLYGVEWGKNPSLSTDKIIPAGSYPEAPADLSKEAHTLVSLGVGRYHWYNAANGREGSLRMLVRLVGDADNWYSGDHAPPGYHGAFSVLSPPILRLSGRVADDTEPGRKSIQIAVKLIESARKAVSADVVFLEGPGSVSGEDIGSFSTQTVRFSGNDKEGTEKAITINVSDSVSFTGHKTAVFSLQNNTAGSIAMPQMIEVEIDAGNEVGGASGSPDIAITEINAVPYDDADGNGVIDRVNDEFVEFVNNMSMDIDISGWTFSDDGTTVRHVFPPETVIPAGGALVLFANEEVIPQGSFGGAVVQRSNQSKSLHLDDDGDVPTLKDAGGNVVVRRPYGIKADGRSPADEATAERRRVRKRPAAEDHERAASTPGVQADGSSYGPQHRMGIGSEGWRAIASPEQNVSFRDLLGDFTIHGIGGSDEPAAEATLYYWDETSGGTFVKPAGVTDIIESGRGYMAYFFKDNKAGVPADQARLPDAIAVDKTRNYHPVSVAVTATDADGNGRIDQNEGFNLLGNPFGVNISVTAVLDALEKAGAGLNRNVLVWNPAAGNGNGAFINLTDGDLIAPFQAFFIRFMEEVSGNVLLSPAELLAGKAKKRGKESREEPFGFDIRLSDGVASDAYQLIFNEDGDIGADRQDAYKLLSLNPGSLNLFSREGTIRLMKNVLPLDLDAVLEVPLLFIPSEGNEAFEFTWEQTGRVPEDWNVKLLDRELNIEIDLKNNSRYDFSISPRKTEVLLTERNRPPLINRQEGAEDDPDPRFVLLISPGAGLASGLHGLFEAAKLYPNYPNPFNSTTTIPFELFEEAEVELSIWNIVGQKVATLIDEVRKGVPDEIIWNAADLPSGIYIAQMEVGGNVYIRKMTLIKY